MPSPDVFDDILGRLISCNADGDQVDQYTTAVIYGGYYNSTPVGTEAHDTEHYRYLRHVLRVIDTDSRLNRTARDEIVSRVMTLFSYNTYHDEQITWRAWYDHETSLYERDAYRLFGLGVLRNTPPYRGV